MKGFLASLAVVFLFIVVAFVTPDVSYAQSGGLVPCNGPDCKACHLVQMGQNILGWFISITIGIIALVFALGGFKMIMSAGDTGAVTSARTMMTNSLIGLIILLTSYLIIDTIMKEVMRGGVSIENVRLGPWNKVECKDTLISVNQCTEAENPPACECEAGGGNWNLSENLCEEAATACNIPALTPITDSLASQMEGGQTVIWQNTSPQLQVCVNKFLSKVGGSVTSAYRPPAYQAHLQEIHSKWCAQLRTNSNEACASLKVAVSGEMAKHQLSCERPVGTNSNHSAGTAVDISGPAHGSQNVLAAAQESCLSWYGQADPVHYQLRSGCTCN